ncbi:acetate/propionate family kinase [Magnetospirillum sp. UT-4]|uniref:acetate/propionate family kinase n=1 Tax=Magnetospirillum sp. UT-4 TaxID=2681467 RepID=UPI00137D6E91|nr:acetate/propionate family kinase [Magnetospirillum sp. UT-4]CAA7625920.1 Acetate kinase [Magnetospirillum sp. UT-4]
MRDGILVINAGSSSIKFSLYVSEAGDGITLSSKGQVEGIHVAPHFEAKDPSGRKIEDKVWDHGDRLSHEVLLEFLIRWVEEHLDGATLRAAGHRVVHGGTRYAKPMLVADGLLDELEALVPLAPLHQPHNLAPIRALQAVHPGLAQVACFDTAFHRTSPRVAEIFGLPRQLTAEGVRRYGFHGLSYEYVSGRLREVAPAVGAGRVVIAHLGSGASMCAVKDGKSVASTMGFTALDGLMMGTRTGNLDPGVVLYLMQQKGMSGKQIEDLLYKQSGLLGVSGISNDMRVLLDSDDPHAAEAVELFVYRIARELGSLAAALGGLDALVFTAGIGERSAVIRERVCALAEWLGVKLDPQANQRNDLAIGAADARVPVFVVPTDEELMIARHTREVLDRQL